MDIANIANWLPPLTMAILFTTMGLLKIYGLVYGIEGGGGKPLKQRMCGM